MINKYPSCSLIPLSDNPSSVSPKPHKAVLQLWPCESVYLFVYLFICLSIYLSVFMHLHIFACLQL